MSKKHDNRVEIILPNTNIKVKFNPAIWNITADKDGSITIENIKSAIDFAHLFGVKVYLTLNILFHDSEFERVDEILTKTLFHLQLRYPPHQP